MSEQGDVLPFVYRDPFLSSMRQIGLMIAGLVMVLNAPLIVQMMVDPLTGVVLGEQATNTAQQQPDPGPDPAEESSSGMPWEVLAFVAAALVLTGGAGGVGVVVHRAAARRRATARHLADRWQQATDGHDRIKDEYAAMRLDPVRALDHLALWDISDAFTERFTLAMAEAGDLRSLHGDGCPQDAQVIATYAAAVTRCGHRWEAARTHARQHGLDVLPRADRSTAAQARKLLTLAANPGASAEERALAASKANGLLDRLRDVAFPDETRQAILAPARRQITAGPLASMDGASSGQPSSAIVL